VLVEADQACCNRLDMVERDCSHTVQSKVLATYLAVYYNSYAEKT
jgi:hypothetical protein